MLTSQDELKPAREAVIEKPPAQAGAAFAPGAIVERIGSVRQELFDLVDALRLAGDSPILQAAADEMQTIANQVGKIQALASRAA